MDLPRLSIISSRVQRTREKSPLRCTLAYVGRVRDMMVRPQLWVSERVSAWPLAGLWGCRRSQRSGAGSRGWAVWGRQAHACARRYLLAKVERDDVFTAYFYIAGNRGFSKGGKRNCGVGHAAEAPSASSGWLFGNSFQPRDSSWCCPSVRLQRAVELGEAARPSALSRPSCTCTCTGPAQLPRRHRSAPREFVGHLSPRFAGRMRYLSSQVSVAWEQVNGSARLFILKRCRRWNGALVRGNWKMCPLLFNFLMSLRQLTEYKEGNLQTSHLMYLVGIFWRHCNIWTALAGALLTSGKCGISMQMQSWHTQ